MPLHDWGDDRGWDSLHLVWQAQLLDWIQPRLPEGYRAYLGAVPALTVDIPNGRPDLGVRNWPAPASSGAVPPAATSDATVEPDVEAVATLTLDPLRAIHIDAHGRLVAAIELVSPRNKHRPEARDRYTSRYLGYVHNGVHLLLIDVLPRPVGFSFADALAAALGIEQPPCPVPFALSYRVGESVPGGTLIARWVRPFRIGDPLPTIPLALGVHQGIAIDLEHTYREAARRVYLN
jgi:hypothetical protein